VATSVSSRRINAPDSASTNPCWHSRMHSSYWRSVMLYTAILVACMATSPQDCRTHEMLIEASPIPTAAFVEAQNKAAEWLGNHPDLTKRSLTIKAGRSA
jgi:hypothetical protein